MDDTHHDINREIVGAIQSRDTNILKHLLEQGADPNYVDDGIPVLTWACYNGSPEMIRLLLEWGANPNLPDVFGSTAIMPACYQGNTKAVQLLLAYDADPNIMDTHGSPPLLGACYHGNPIIVRLLMEYGASPNVEGNRGTPILKTASSLGPKRDSPIVTVIWCEATRRLTMPM